MNRNNVTKKSRYHSADGRPETEKGSEPAQKKRITSKQIVALTGVILLVLLYVAALAAALFDSSASGKLFQICLFATVAVPVLIWVYIWMYGKLTGKKTISDLHPTETDK